MRYQQIGKTIADMIERMPADKQRQEAEKFFQAYTKAPLFLIEMNPVLTLKEIQSDVEGLAEFFHLPYKSFLMDFPVFSKIEKCWPFMFIRQLNDEMISLQNINPSWQLDPDEWIDLHMTDGLVDPKIANLSPEMKRRVFDLTIKGMPLSVQTYVIKKVGHTWNEAKLTWDTYPNPVCPHPRNDVYLMPGGGLQPYRECNYGCGGNLDKCCIFEFENAKLLWALLFYSCVYINYPANIVIEESERLTVREQRQREKAIKPASLLNKKPRIRVLTLEQLKILRHKTGPSGTRASPIPHSRIGHWRILRSEKFTVKRGQRVWVKNTDVGELSWESEKAIYRVIEKQEKNHEN
jgi:hypothetical protein